MKLKTVLTCFFLAVFLVSCGSKRKVVTKKDTERDQRTVVNDPRDEGFREVERKPAPRNNYSYTVESYIQEYAPIAREEMQLYRIPASITLAQGILESGAGNGDLTRRANNHFGIKCHDWTGEKAYHDDDRRGECFRKYRHAKYSYRDHSLFLANRSRYAFLFDLDSDDYKGWAKGLRKAGYATDRRYPDKLIDLIERYELYRYDSDVPENRRKIVTSSEKPVSNETHRVQKGDTLYSIAKKYNTTVEAIKETNRLSGNTISIGQILNIR